MPDPDSANFEIARLADLPPTECPCGTTRRAFVDAAAGGSIHLVEISADARTHYHRRLTEIYYILAGEGEMELDGRRVPVAPGDAVLIRPGCRHRAIGQLQVLNVVIPGFDADDECFD